MTKDPNIATWDGSHNPPLSGYREALAKIPAMTPEAARKATDGLRGHFRQAEEAGRRAVVRAANQTGKRGAHARAAVQSILAYPRLPGIGLVSLLARNPEIP